MLPTASDEAKKVWDEFQKVEQWSFMLIFFQIWGLLLYMDNMNYRVQMNVYKNITCEM